MLIVFIVLSTIARLSGGTFEPLEKITSDWEKYYGNFSRIQDPLTPRKLKQFIEEYMTPMLKCGRPNIDDQRWFIKSLSNDQTAFTGFTSLVEIGDILGYKEQIKLKPTVFIEPFIYNILDKQKQEKLLDLKYQLESLDSTKINEINDILKQAEKLCPKISERSKGKTPLFFYGISDKSFFVPKNLYQQMEYILDNAVTSLKEKVNSSERLAFTGSVDFMIDENTNEIYLIDIGFPAVGYIADILACSKVQGINPNTGIDRIASNLDEITLMTNKNNQELGFFKLEKEYLISELKKQGVKVFTEYGEGEAKINNILLPNKDFDFYSRDQQKRYDLVDATLPKNFVSLFDDFWFKRNYEKVKSKYGLVIKKRMFGSDQYKRKYYKPLVTPIWSREMLIGKNVSTLYEQFIESLVDIDIAGDRKGKRSYEIRMYFYVK